MNMLSFKTLITAVIQLVNQSYHSIEIERGKKVEKRDVLMV
jgi:hypothetical protein